MARQQTRTRTTGDTSALPISPPVWLHALTKHVSGSTPARRDIWARFPPALLFGAMLAVAGGLLLPDDHIVTTITLTIGMVAAAWILSFLFPLHQVWSASFLISTPLFSYLLTEILIGNIRFNPFLLYLTDMQSFLNLCGYGVIAVLLFVLTGRLRFSAGMGAVMGWIWGNFNAYLLRFRGRILFPADFHALRTAAMVGDDYDWTPALTQILSCLWLLGFLLALWLVVPVRKRGRQDAARLARRAETARRTGTAHLPLRLSLAAACLLGLSLFFGTSLISRLGVQPSQWFTQQNGVLLNFMINLKNSRVTRPAAYASALTDMRQASGQPPVSFPQGVTGSTNTPSSLLSADGQRPNLIVIMNEAFSDMRVLGNLQTSADPLPFLYSLEGNTISGKAYSSVIGGNTANSEYEFLTGNTMAFLPAGMVSYQIYTAPGDYSLAGQLNRYGYKSIAMHPYDSAGWNRVQVYNNYGFSEMHFIDAFENKQYVRNYVSDRSNYKELIRRFDAFRAEDGETPLFFMNVTMQNHGGYRQTWDRLAHRVHVMEPGYTEASDLEGDNAEINQYLSLVKESDDALKMLLTHFEKVDEPTIILMFGDHQPKLSDSFYQKIFGKAPQSLTVEETERMYTVPFMLWANYDIPEAQDVRISLNYLATLLLETADLPLTPYQRFLSDMRTEVPVINSMGMSGKDGVFVSGENALSKAGKAYVSQYRAYQFNGIFDRKHRVDAFFLGIAAEE